MKLNKKLNYHSDLIVYSTSVQACIETTLLIIDYLAKEFLGQHSNEIITLNIGVIVHEIIDKKQRVYYVDL